MKNNLFHIDFKLNGKSFSTSNELIFFSKDLASSTEQFFIDWFDDNDFIKVQTSGSTGKPKAIKLRKEFMINSAFATGSFFDLKEKTNALLCMSTDFIAGKMMLVRALVLGWNLDVIEPVSNPLEITKGNYDFSAMVPMQLQNSLSEIDRIKKLIVGGGIVSSDLEKQLQNISTEVFSTFGMTETITHIAVRRLNHDVISSGVEKSLYQTLPNVSISKDERNCLVINAQKISENTIVTNDVVEIKSTTKFKWLGRFDNVINSGGIKLHPEEIENKLAKIISQRFFVAGIPDEKLGEKLVLIVELQSSKVAQLSSYLNNNIKRLDSLSKFEKPKAIYFVDAFIETDTKKIQRNKTLDILFKL